MLHARKPRVNNEFCRCDLVLDRKHSTHICTRGLLYGNWYHSSSISCYCLGLTKGNEEETIKQYYSKPTELSIVIKNNYARKKARQKKSLGMIMFQRSFLIDISTISYFGRAIIYLRNDMKYRVAHYISNRRHCNDYHSMQQKEGNFLSFNISIGLWMHTF